MLDECIHPPVPNGRLLMSERKLVDSSFLDLISDAWCTKRVDSKTRPGRCGMKGLQVTEVYQDMSYQTDKRDASPMPRSHMQYYIIDYIILIICVWGGFRMETVSILLTVKLLESWRWCASFLKWDWEAIPTYSKVEFTCFVNESHALYFHF